MALTTDTFDAVGAGTEILLRPGQTVAWTITVGEGDEFVGAIALQSAARPGVYETVRADDGVLVEYTGTEAVPLEGSVASGTATNDTGKDRLYRFYCVDFDEASDDIVSTISHAFVEGYRRGIDPAAIYADLRLSNGFCILTGKGAPTDGTSGTGAGYAGPGSLYVDVTNAVLYINTNTAASPLWSYVGLQTT